MDSPAVSGVSWSLHTLVDVAGTGRSDDPIPLSLLVERLHAGLDLIDTDVVSAFSPVLPRGRYLISLMQIEPVLVYPDDDLDYWTHESVLLFGRPVPFGELPHYTATPYYRIGSHVLEPQGEQFITRNVKSESERDFETVEHQRRAAIYAMVAPMIPTTILDRTAIEAYRKDRLGTAVAVSILDARCPGVMKREAVAPGIDGIHAHWCWTHMVLDGHYRLFAAALEARPLTLLSFTALDESVAEDGQVSQLVSALRSIDGHELAE